jgi:flagellar motor switch protein FliM
MMMIDKYFLYIFHHQKKYFKNKFGSFKKINSSLHRKTKLKTTNMLRIQLHIETANCFSSPKGDYNNCGACYADE